MGSQTRPSYDGRPYGYSDYVRPPAPELSEFEREMLAIREEQKNYLNLILKISIQLQAIMVT